MHYGRPQEDIVPTCRELGIAFLAYSPLGGSGDRAAPLVGRGTGESSAGRFRGQTSPLGGSGDSGQVGLGTASAPCPRAPACAT